MFKRDSGDRDRDMGGQGIVSYNDLACKASTSEDSNSKESLQKV